MTLSHSSATTLLGCEQKYYYYKVKGVDKDSDYIKSDALAIGSAVHDILERSRHLRPASLSKSIEVCMKDPYIQLKPEHTNMVAAMVLKYCRLHEQMAGELKVIEVEFELKTETVIGYVDALLQEPDGGWWICDVKTWKSLMPSKFKEAAKDPQLNLYAAHADQIAERFDLDLKKFRGCKWRVVTKSAAKQKATESDTQFIKRLADKHLHAHDISIPVEAMDPKGRLASHKKLFKLAERLKSGRLKPVQNYSNCFSFFSPCEYWSRCHGKLYSEDTPEVTVVSI